MVICLETAEAFMKAFANKCRLIILDLLADGPCTVTGILEATGLEQSHVSHHLEQLLKTGLIEMTCEGQTHRYGLAEDKQHIVMSVITCAKEYTGAINAARPLRKR